VTIRLTWGRWPAAAAVLLGVGAASPLTAQQSKPNIVPDEPSFVAVAVRAEAPKLDGRLDDPSWSQAQAVGGFVQRDPNEGEPGTERTEARIIYTDDAIFIGVRAFDSDPGGISSKLTRRDESSPSDWIGVMIDSYHDRRTAFEFAVNPAGVKRDIYRFNDSNSDTSWDAVWDVATAVDGEGWTAEFRIAFSQLRFGRADRHRFGFNVYRIIARKNEEQHWKLHPKDQSGFVSQFGDLAGIEGIDPPRRVEIMPYVSSTAALQPSQPGNPFQDGSEQRASIGADLSMGITSNLTLSATVNPDFGQVEADPAVVNLSAFETRFPEKRPFFQEGIDVFQFSAGGSDLFYTRRIGRAPQGSADPRGGYADRILQTTILGAAKLSGKTPDGWTVGFLGAVTPRESARAVDSRGTFHEDPVEPASAYFVGRLSKDLRGGKTQIGMLATATNRSLPAELQFLRSAAYTGGINWTHRFLDDGYSVYGHVAGSYVRGSEDAIERAQLSSARYYQRPDNDYVTFDPTRTSLSGFAGQIGFEKRTGDWRGSAGIDTKSPGFEINDLGFQQNADETEQWAWVQRRWVQPGKVFRSFYLNFNQWSGYNYGWDRIYAGGNVNFNYTFPNYWGGWAGINRNVSALATGALRGGPALNRPGAWNAWVGFESDDRKPIRGWVEGWWWGQDESDSWEWGLVQNLSWRPASNLDLQASPRYERSRDTWQFVQTATVADDEHFVFGVLDQTTWSMTFRGNLTFTPELSLQLYAEPFISTGDYVGFRQVAQPRTGDFNDQFDDFAADRLIENDGNVAIDLDRDGTGEIDLGTPDFTFLSFRSNVVLRWEYKLGSTIFFVWQHGRSDFNSNDRFSVRRGFTDLFQADAANTFLVKVNYWLSL